MFASVPCGVVAPDCTFKKSNQNDRARRGSDSARAGSVVLAHEQRIAEAVSAVAVGLASQL